MSDRMWKYVGASAQGTSHLSSGLPCQDAARWISFETAEDGEVLVLAVADGAGSAVRAADGAKLACDQFLTQVSRYLKGGTISTITKSESEVWVCEIAQTIDLQAKSCGLAARDFACTLLAAILGRDYAVCLQIGDGAIVIAEESEYQPVFWPQSGEFANTTYFVTDETALEQLQFRLFEKPIDEIALFSDGVQMLALQYNTKAAHVPFFRPMFARLRQEFSGESEALTRELEQFLHSPAINDRTDDDKTLVLATRLLSDPPFSPTT